MFPLATGVLTDYYIFAGPEDEPGYPPPTTPEDEGEDDPNEPTGEVPY